MRCSICQIDGCVDVEAEMNEDDTCIKYPSLCEFFVTSDNDANVVTAIENPPSKECPCIVPGRV